MPRLAAQHARRAVESCALYLTVMARDCAGSQDRDKSRQRGSGLLVNIFRACEGSDLDGH
jgi:hypothetical protein